MVKVVQAWLRIGLKSLCYWSTCSLEISQSFMGTRKVFMQILNINKIHMILCLTVNGWRNLPLQLCLVTVSIHCCSWDWWVIMSAWLLKIVILQSFLMVVSVWGSFSLWKVYIKLSNCLLVLGLGSEDLSPYKRYS